MGGLYFWNRRTRETARQPPAGVNVVWIGTLDEGGRLPLLAQGNACQYVRPSSSSWVAGLRGEGLGIPSPLLGCHSALLSRQEWFWRVRSSPWYSSWWATWSGWLLQVAGGERGV